MHTQGSMLASPGLMNLSWGFGARNARGVQLGNWVLQNGFQIVSRQSDTQDIRECWTCERYFDETRVQLDYIIADEKAIVSKVWNDNMLPIGLDHRCVHCLLTWKVQKCSKYFRETTLKHWKPFLDEDGTATLYHMGLKHIDANNTHDPQHLPRLEKQLFDAGLKGGYSKQTRCKYESSNALRDLRAQRRHAAERSIKKRLSFEIARMHRRELRAWKSSRLQQLLSMPNQWKMLQKMSHTVVRQCAQHPPANDFADMLENIFHGHPGIPTRPLQLTEPNWSLQELKGAIERMKANKASDECGLVAELLHFAPENVVTALLGIMNQILHTGQVPSSWQKTMFQMLPKTKNARTTKDFRPIANIRLMYKTFAYLILGRIEEPLEHAQPEEQHGFRTKRRIEEHLLSANMVIDKTLLGNKPLWILSLDLSKAFDRVDWDALWSGLRLHGVSVRLIWLLQLMYSNQTGQISGHSDVSREFCIKAGVRQGCVLSPRLFCSVLQLAMEDWRCDVSNNGLDLGDGGPPLLDLRFADDILLFAGSAEQLGYMLDKLVTLLGKVGLKLNAAKTKVLTTQAQPPKTLTTRAGLEIGVLDQSSSHKWLGCMLSTANAGRRQDDIDHRLQSAARAFHVHKWILCDKMVSMASRLKFFDAMITSVVCFAAGHRKIYTNDLRKLDVHCRKLLRRVVGPPADIDWNQPWHTILHSWHNRIDQQLKYHGFKIWSAKYLSEYWKFANYVALLDENRWVKRILHWNAGGGRPGRSFFQWQTPIQNFCRWHRLGDWLDIAQSTDLWFQYYEDFVSFVQL